MSPEYQETYIKTSSIHSSLFVNGQNDFTQKNKKLSFNETSRI